MSFKSIDFLLFLPIVLLLYFNTPFKFRWFMLLVSSYIFYMWWKPEYIFLIIISTIIDYCVGLKMGATKNKNMRKFYLLISLFSNLSLLFIFKYFNFISNSLNTIFSSLKLGQSISSLEILLPVGISFYTFQTLSYSIDVYRRKIEPEKHFGIFALYVSFFPQLVAGPIERSSHLLPQFHQEHKFNYDRFLDGMMLICWGFFKKIVIADNLALHVNNVYNNVEQYTGWALIIATVFFAFQIYCDFSGYSNIARGIAKIMGYDLMLNFNKPYFSRSIPEFWKRWHISLSTWFKDYLYIPLGGNRVKKSRYYFNLLIVFLISGLWHGAAWKFVIWGALHGIFQIISITTKNYRKSFVSIIKLDKKPFLHSIIQRCITFGLVCFAWIFFRANSLNDALYICSHLFKFQDLSLQFLKLGKLQIVLLIGPLLFMTIIHIFENYGSVYKKLKHSPTLLKWSFYYAIIFMIILLGVYGNEELSQFIYFQF